jgi:hypothetical protein
MLLGITIFNLQTFYFYQTCAKMWGIEFRWCTDLADTKPVTLITKKLSDSFVTLLLYRFTKSNKGML